MPPKSPVSSARFFSSRWAVSARSRPDWKAVTMVSALSRAISATSFAVGVHRGGKEISRSAGIVPMADMHSAGSRRRRMGASTLWRRVST